LKDAFTFDDYRLVEMSYYVKKRNFSSLLELKKGKEQEDEP